MKRLFLALFFASCSFGQSHEILNPTVSNGLAGSDQGCHGTNLSSSPNVNSWVTTVSGTTAATRYKNAHFLTWQTTTNTYTALVLKVTSFSNGYFADGAGIGAANLTYSINGGITWTTIESDTGNGWAFTTDIITLSPTQDLTKLRVGACVQGNIGTVENQGTDDINISSIWTDGTYTPSGGGGTGTGNGNSAQQVIIISELLWQIVTELL